VLEKRSRVAWPGVSTGGGDLEGVFQGKIRGLLNEFGMVLEEETIKAGINIFVFPIFRPFNLLAALTSDLVYCAFSPASGLPTQTWLDWRSNPKTNSPQELAVALQQQLGWTAISILTFPSRLLDSETAARENELRTTAISLVESVILEAEKRARIVRLNPIFIGRDFMVEHDLCFVLMPFREPFFRLYQDHLKPTLEEMGLRAIKSDDIFTPTVIVEDIWEYINRAGFLVADVTGKNPNVFYELGIAHTVGKDVIILTQSEDDIPFDLRHLRHLTYVDNQEGWQALRQNLQRAVKAVLGK